jgi:hypothetical protein
MLEEVCFPERHTPFTAWKVLKKGGGFSPPVFYIIVSGQNNMRPTD